MVKKSVGLAIITPTLNEEKYIGILLESIASQTVSPAEIVVVDAYSKDKTAQVVKSWQNALPQLKFYQIEKSTISRQRNFGVDKTTGANILFLDADMKLKDPQALEKYLAEVGQRSLDLAAAPNYPLSEFWKDGIYFWMMDMSFRLIRPIWPLCQAPNLFVKRDVFKKVGRFNEAIRVGEDHEFVQRSVRSGAKFRFLNTLRLHTSSRRLEKEGRVNYTLKNIKALYHILRSGYKDIPVDYKFGHH